MARCRASSCALACASAAALACAAAVRCAFSASAFLRNCAVRKSSCGRAPTCSLPSRSIRTPTNEPPVTDAEPRPEAAGGGGGGGASFVDSAHACSGAASFGAFSPGVGGTLPARDVHALDANCVGAALSAVDAELGGACCGAKSSEYMSAGFAARALPGGGCGVLTGGGSAAAFDGAAKRRS